MYHRRILLVRQHLLTLLMGSFSQDTRVCVLPPSTTPEQPAALGPSRDLQASAVPDDGTVPLAGGHDRTGQPVAPAPQTVLYTHQLSDMMGHIWTSGHDLVEQPVAPAPNRTLHTHISGPNCWAAASLRIYTDLEEPPVALAPKPYFTQASANSKHWFTTYFLQPLPYLVTPWGPENCQLTSSFLLVLKQ